MVLVPAAAARADVSLTAAQHEMLGIRTVAAMAATAPLRVPALARVVDPLPWIKLDADWRAATTAARAAQREAERAQRLHAADSSVSGRAAETADSQAAAERARRESLAAERSLTMGTALTGMDDAARRRLFADLALGRARILRFEALRDVPAGTAFDGASLDGPASAQPIQWLGRAPQANPASLVPGFLGVAPGLDASPGEAVGARLHSSQRAQDGVQVPETAVLRWHAAAWVYRAQGPDTFVRVAVTLLQRLDDGSWLASGVQPGEAIVVAGAAALLTADLGQAAAAGEH